MIDKELDSVEKKIFFVDVKRLFFRHKKNLIRIALVFAVMGFLYKASKAPSYAIEASFFERSDSKKGGVVENLLAGMGKGKMPQEAAVMLQSHVILKRLVEDLGLQALVKEPKGFFQKVSNRIYEAVSCEMGFPLPEFDTFRLKNVSVTDGEAAYYQIVFSDRENFQIFSSPKNCIAEGVVGESLSFEKVTLTIYEVPKKLKTGMTYELIIEPVMSVMRNYKSSISLGSHKLNRSLLTLKYGERDYKKGVMVINHLMDIYREYLIKDNEEFAQTQLEYLMKRQDSLTAGLKKNLKEKKHQQIKNILETGSAGFRSQVKNVEKPIGQCAEELDEIDLELKWLEYPESISTFQFLSSAKEGEVAALKGQINHLKQERDNLDLALSLRHKDSLESPLQHEVHNQSFFKRSQDLSALRNKKRSAEDILAQFKSEEPVGGLIGQTSLQLLPWAALEQGNDSFQRKDFEDYMQKMIHSFSLQEQRLQKMDWYAPPIPSEIEGIDLATSEKLYMGYNTELDDIAVKIHHYQYILKQVADPKFELTSLGTALSDSVSQKIISETSVLALQMKDFANRSSKEMERLKKEFDLQRRFLTQHIEEMIVLKRLHSDLIKKKIESLQYVTLQCIDRQLAAINQQVFEKQKSHQEHLKLKREVTEKRLENLKLKMAEAPNQWYLEELLDFKKNLSVQVIQSMTRLVESKTIERQLMQVSSRPLDRATASKGPNRQLLGLYTIVFAFLGSGFAFSLLLLKELVQGFPISDVALRFARQHVCGDISLSCDGPEVEYIQDSDLETLRQVVLFAGNHKPQVIGLLSGQGPNYSHTLSSLFVKKGYRVLLMECVFGAPWKKGDAPGILQNLEDLRSFNPIRMKNLYDYIPSGGTTRFGVEKISSESFFKLLEKAKKNYDKIILFSRAPLAFAEAREYMMISDRLVLTMQNEKMDDLDSYIQWDSMSTEEKLSFVMFKNESGLV